MFARPPSFCVRRALANLRTDPLYNISVADALHAKKLADALYKESVVLYSSALLNDDPVYYEALSLMEAKFKEAPDDSFKAWMLGRVALAATHKKDNKTVEKTLPVLKDLLKPKKVAEDEFRAWALGYLASVNPVEYIIYRKSMLDAVNKVTKKPDQLWAHVMNLQAAARAPDEQTFFDILEQMKTTTGKTTVVEALKEIPEDDWQAWALGITAEMATKMDKHDLLKELERPLASAIFNANQPKTIGNAMLAQISATAAATATVQEKTPRSSL